MTVVRRSRRYRRDERHEFDPGPCPDCGATGRFTVTWIAASISGEDPAEYADRLLAIAEALNLEVSLVSVARATTSGQSPSHRTASSRTSDRSL